MADGNNTAFNILDLLKYFEGLAGKPGEQLTSGDAGRVFSPEFGILTNTYTQPEETLDETDEDIRARITPNMNQIAANPDFDELAGIIANDVLSGVPSLQTKRTIREKLAAIKFDGKDKEQAAARKVMMDDYMDLLATLSKEQNQYVTEVTKNKYKPKKETMFSKAGLPEPDASYDASGTMGNINARLMDRINEVSTGPIAARKYAPGQLPAGKTDVPVRTELVKKQRAEQAMKDTLAIQQQREQQMARRGMGSPLLDALTQRALMIKILEDPSKLAKLAQSQG